MSSSQDCTCQNCQETMHLEGKRYHNNIYSNRRQDLRHHHAKRRFPPTKKDLFPKDISLKGKFNKKTIIPNIPQFVLFPEYKNQYKNNAATPSKYKIYDQNPFLKLNTNTSIETLLHAVGQSQREKLMKGSPSPLSGQTQTQVVYRNAPLTDRDRKMNDPPKGQIINMQKKRPVSHLDDNFLKNFLLEQKKIEELQQASPSEHNSQQ